MKKYPVLNLEVDHGTSSNELIIENINIFFSLKKKLVLTFYIKKAKKHLFLGKKARKKAKKHLFPKKARKQKKVWIFLSMMVDR